MKTRIILYSLTFISICVLLVLVLIIVLQVEPSFVFYKNIRMLNTPSIYLANFNAKLTYPGRIQSLNLHMYKPEIEKVYSFPMQGGISLYQWDSEKRKFIVTNKEYGYKIKEEDPTNLGIFSDSKLWESVFRDKHYTIKEDRETGLWKITVPATEVREAILEDQKKTIIAINQLSQSHKYKDSCFRGLVDNMEVINVTSDANLTGDLIIQIDPETKLFHSIEVPDFEAFEVQYSGTSCNNPEEKVSGFYDIVSTEPETFLVDEIAEKYGSQKKFEFFDKLEFMLGRIEI